MVVYLYRAQQRIASRRLIVILTTLRVLLIGLMFVLLLGPVLQWRHRHSSGGTLWIALDRSGSMSRVDAQSTPIEQLRWADALGYLPKESRPSRLDRHAAALGALRDEWVYLRNLADQTDESGAKVLPKNLTSSLSRWNDSLAKLVDELAKDPAVKPVEATVISPLRSTVEGVKNTVTAANDGDEAAAAAEQADPPAKSATWDGVTKDLAAALAALQPLADQLDQQFLNDKAADGAVQAALVKASVMTRYDLAAAGLTEKTREDGVAMVDAVRKHNTKLLTFAATPQPADTSDRDELIRLVRQTDATAATQPTTNPSAPAPTGQSTNLAAALQFISDQIGNDERASVLVISDGRQNVGGDLVEPSRLLASRGVRVFTLAVGSRQVAPDATVDTIDAPEWVFKDDTLKASALLRLDGLAGKPVKVEFRRGDTVISTQTVTPSQSEATERVRFEDKPPDAGLFEYEVRIAEATGETITDNNRQTLRVAVKKDKLAVLVIEDQPRWEYRYLTNYLERDGRVKLQKLLFQPARIADVKRPEPLMASPDNPSVEADRLPDTPEKWAAFDLIVLGDVPPEKLPAKSQEMIAKAVKDRGAALLVIAGQQNMPARYSSAPVAELLPVELANDWPPPMLEAHRVQGFAPAVAPEGVGSVLSQFTVDDNDNAQLWGSVPPWYWHSEQTRTKLPASVIWAIAEPKDPTAGAPTTAPTPDPADDVRRSLDAARRRSLLSTMPVGLGRVMYLASDATWRLRQVNGENLHERFWGQVVRWAVSDELPAGGKLVRFGADRPHYVAGEPVVVTARLLGKDLVPLSDKEVKVIAKALPARDPKTGAVAGEGQVLGETTLEPLKEAPGYYRASLTGLPAGPVELSLGGEDATRLLSEDPSVTTRTHGIDVRAQADVELQNVNADRPTLARVAQAGGGTALDACYADVLAGMLPDLKYESESVDEVGLFSDPKSGTTRATHWVFLIAFVSLITAEWAVRKLGGLV